jgi:hypothetical protein
VWRNYKQQKTKNSHKDHNYYSRIQTRKRSMSRMTHHKNHKKFSLFQQSLRINSYVTCCDSLFDLWHYLKVCRRTFEGPALRCNFNRWRSWPMSFSWHFAWTEDRIASFQAKTQVVDCDVCILQGRLNKWQLTSFGLHLAPNWPPFHVTEWGCS